MIRKDSREKTWNPLFINWFRKNEEGNNTQLSDEKIIAMLDAPLGYQFLVIWSCFERSCAGGYFRSSKIKEYSRNNINAFQVEGNTLIKIAKKFHSRYQDKRKYKRLRHKDRNQEVDAILDKNFELLSEQEQLTLLLYVIFRYRNNIFHGNKGVSMWNQFDEQINDCIDVMSFVLASSGDQRTE